MIENYNPFYEMNENDFKLLIKNSSRNTIGDTSYAFIVCYPTDQTPQVL